MLARPLTTLTQCDALVPLFTPRLLSASLHHGRCAPAYTMGRRVSGWHLQMTTRGKKTKTTVRLEDLPQGVISFEPPPLVSTNGPAQQQAAAEAAPDSDDGPAYPTVLLQARRNMQRFDNCVLLTRVGGFYELYFEHADEYGPLLNLKVAQKKTTAGPVSMAGFPFFQLERFLKILVQDLNRYVAVAEEFPKNAADKIKSGGLMHDRRVARIITPGTLIDENFMDPYVNNYVLAIHAPSPCGTATVQASSVTAGRDALGASPPSTCLGLAWLDLSTGQFFTEAANMSALPSVLSRISPKEVVLDQALQSSKDHDVVSILAEDRHLITYHPPGEATGLADWAPMLESEVPEDRRAAFTSEEVTAGSLLLNYVGERLQGLSLKLQPPVRHGTMSVMSIDKNTMRALEIKQTIRDGYFRGSLLHAIRRTVTKSGARLLNEWLSAPSTSLEVIEARLDLVTCFIEKADLRDTVILLLRRSHDSQRLVQKFALGRGDPDDLLALASTVQACNDIATRLSKAAKTGATANCLAAVIARLDLKKPTELARRIQEAIDEEGVVHQHEIEDGEAGHMMALAQEIVHAEGSQDDAAAVIPKTTVKKPGKTRPTSVREYYADDNEAWVMKPSASPRLERLHAELTTPRLCETCHPFRGAACFPSPPRACHPQSRQAPPQPAVLDELDIATSLALLARDQGLTRPRLNHSTTTTILGGRHPTVEGGLTERGRSFVRNDCLLGPAPAHAPLWLITGPNMAGKSTFLRQNALITVLAQTGCYVPAAHAELGLVDALFSRVGSADNLYRDQSTFMVEMLETAHILRAATPRSLVIMDEIGRGTTPEDGAAVAFASLQHLVTVNRCRALFATHFHAVADLAAARGLCGRGEGDGRDAGRVETYCTDVEEDDSGGFVYVHKLRKGVNRQSHALKVARLAGLPASAIQVAGDVLGEVSGDRTTKL
ncbi:DNA mismatch repair protein mutS [Verticillium alfalfae VaMs.102]|uniref:DNA mismatch repair protein mutS n=1 Tax=Verticillium alfalfae (strain VaMs.102 / ATCC MYA-4576 / FGSC 10136) TaxID=526221 RepID=C9SI73_VERA1|nr:DNA mismatch repair protein mutS [Verticillium alfalfae VaMs.102]EEY18646.1 DNA mismatch repair protein mutS [Verticillium alfalfae VaMs.102]